MAKRKKIQPSKKASPRPPVRQRKSVPKKKKGKASKRKPYLNADGTPNKRYRKIAKYLTKDGKLNKRVALPFNVKTADALFKKLYPQELPPWFTKSGEVRKSMQKYLTKKGELRKNVKLPKGVKNIKQLWEWVQGSQIKRADDQRLRCIDITEPHWVVKESVTKSFRSYRKVFMGGKEIKFSTWVLQGDDYIDGITEWLASPPVATYSICFFKKYKYLFV